MSGFLNVWAKKVHIVSTRVVKRKLSSRVPSGTLQGLLAALCNGGKKLQTKTQKGGGGPREFCLEDTNFT